MYHIKILYNNIKILFVRSTLQALYVQYYILIYLVQISLYIKIYNKINFSNYHEFSIQKYFQLKKTNKLFQNFSK